MPIDWPFHLQTLGDLRITAADARPLVIRRKLLALVTYLARRSPLGTSRSELATLFWGDRDQERARQSLRQALAELRQTLGTAIQADVHEVRLADGAVVLDLAMFDRYVREGRDEEAAACWAGEFIPQADDVGGEGFERWVEVQRAAALRRLGAVMERLIGGAELRRDWDRAIAWAERWAVAAPFDERAHERLVEALRMQGREGEALDRHQQFVARLRVALDVEPSPEFLRLGDELHDLHERTRAEAARRARPSAGLRFPALIGRGHEIAALTAAWRMAIDGKPTIVLVSDDGGGGKTRLAEEVARIIAEGAERTIVLRASGGTPGGDAGRHHAHEVARRLFAPLADAPGSAGASPEALAACTAIIPQLAVAFPHLPEPDDRRVALSDGMAELLGAVSEETPVLLLLDDLHRGDAATLSLIVSLASRLAGRTAMILLCDESTREGAAAIDALLAVPGVVRLRPRPLDVSEVDAMLASMLTVDDAERAPLAARLHGETLGIPLLVHETVAALVEERLLVVDRAGTWRTSRTLEGRHLPLSPAIRERIAVRLEPLSPAARTLFDAATVLGTPVVGTLLEAVAGLSPDETAIALRELTTHRLMTEEATAGEVIFTHPVLARVGYALLSPSERRTLHARAAAEMSARDMTTTAERSALPYHLARTAPRRGQSSGSGTATPGGDRRKGLRARAGRTVLAGGALVATLFAVVRGTDWRSRGDAPGADARRVLVGALQNRSRVAALDELASVATDYVVRGLDETGIAEIVGVRAAAVGEVGTMAALDAGSTLRVAAREAGAGTIVTGTLDRLGDSLVLQATLVDGRNGSLLRTLPPVSAHLSMPLEGVDRFRREVAGALASAIDPNFDYERGGGRRPPTYEAYVALMRGDEAYNRGDNPRAEAAYREAAAADSAYVLPQLRLAVASFDLGRCDRVDSIAGALQRRRVPLTAFEGLYLDRVRAFCRGDWEAAHIAARRTAELTPRSQRARFAAAISALSVNRPNEALGQLRSMDPSHGWVAPDGRYWIVLAIALHMAGDSSAIAELASRLQRAPRDYFVVVAQAYAHAVLGEAEGFESAVTELLAPTHRATGTRLHVLPVMVDELRAHGQATEAARVSERLAAAVARRASSGAARDTLRAVEGELLYRAGMWEASARIASELVQRSPRDVHLLALVGRAAARRGDRATAERTREALAALGDPSLRGASSFAAAQIAAVQGAPEEGVRLLERAAAEGVSYSPERRTTYLGHADVDLHVLMGNRALQALLRRRD